MQKYSDKEKILQNKYNLPTGIYINEEYPLDVKKNHDKLQPILRLAKSQSHYRDKCRLTGDRLIINRASYMVHDLHRLPDDLAPCKVMQKENSEYIVFYREYSPWSNFHPSPFHKWTTISQCRTVIQYQKVILFRDSSTANKILQADTPQECKRLSHQINGVNNDQWQADGFELCIEPNSIRMQTYGLC